MCFVCVWSASEFLSGCERTGGREGKVSLGTRGGREEGQGWGEDGETGAGRKSRWVGGEEGLRVSSADGGKKLKEGRGCRREALQGEPKADRHQRLRGLP